MRMKKRIVICSNYYPPNFLGGAELIAHFHAKTLQMLGNDVIIFCGDVRPYGERYSLRRELYDGLCIYRVSLTGEDFDIKNINFFHKKIEDYFEILLDNFSPDIVHLHNIIGLSLGLISQAKKRRIKVFLTLHDNWAFCPKNTILFSPTQICEDFSQCIQCIRFINENGYRFIPLSVRQDFFKYQLSKIDCFISPSQHLADNYIKAGFPKDKFKIISYGIDVE